MFTITSENAVRLTWRAQEVLLHDMFFAHALMTCTVDELKAFRSVLDKACYLRSNPMTDAEKEVHRGLKLTDRALRRQQEEKQNMPRRYRKVFKPK